MKESRDEESRCKLKTLDIKKKRLRIVSFDMVRKSNHSVTRIVKRGPDVLVVSL